MDSVTWKLMSRGGERSSFPMNPSQRGEPERTVPDGVPNRPRHATGASQWSADRASHRRHPQGGSTGPPTMKKALVWWFTGNVTGGCGAPRTRRAGLPIGLTLLIDISPERTQIAVRAALLKGSTNRTRCGPAPGEVEAVWPPGTAIN